MDAARPGQGRAIRDLPAAHRRPRRLDTRPVAQPHGRPPCATAPRRRGAAGRPRRCTTCSTSSPAPCACRYAAASREHAGPSRTSCAARCVLGRHAAVIVPPPGADAAGVGVRTRGATEGTACACELNPMLGVIGMAAPPSRRRSAPATSQQLESIAISIAPVVENARLYPGSATAASGSASTCSTAWRARCVAVGHAGPDPHLQPRRRGAARLPRGGRCSGAAARRRCSARTVRR
mgnify:CR=1 FL=1